MHTSKQGSFQTVLDVMRLLFHLLVGHAISNTFYSSAAQYMKMRTSMLNYQTKVMKAIPKKSSDYGQYTIKLFNLLCAETLFVTDSTV